MVVARDSRDLRTLFGKKKSSYARQRYLAFSLELVAEPGKVYLAQRRKVRQVRKQKLYFEQKLLDDCCAFSVEPTANPTSGGIMIEPRA
jgi:hypothetical protein